MLYFVIQMQTDQGIKCLNVDKAGELAGADPDYGIKDLYESIANNNFVSLLMPNVKSKLFVMINRVVLVIKIVEY